MATSITAFVGRAARGPVDEPVPIAGVRRVRTDRFGGLWRDSGLGYAVRDFFINGGSSALVVRVVHARRPALDARRPGRDGLVTLSAGAEGLVLAASGPGAWANVLEVEVSHPAGADAEDIARGQGVEPT